MKGKEQSWYLKSNQKDDVYYEIDAPPWCEADDGINLPWNYSFWGVATLKKK